ncbi:restriction endonuclease subunit S [Bacillus toyonensis]|uniref:restriction endonuclease subunit S n=1 Tax=Bacillus toyonensis TaxID=155322 RepID=UPI000BF5A662|nr:restriction endonuclease subunit S [Bacillus toyonensis]PFY42968.1 restriction endonuclease subunit S [Bacillus toyonensis]
MTRKMKDSKIEWIGAIPNYWKVVPSNLFFYNSSKKVEGNVEQLTASQKYGVISQSRFMKLESQMPVQKRDLSDLKQVDKGDFVISLRSFQGGLEIAQESGGITPAYTVLKEKTKQTYAGYYKYFFKSEMYIQALRGTVLDTIRDGKAIRFSNFSMVPIVLPPLNEQKKIVEVLNEKTKTINNIISDTQQSIEELKKYKQSLITEAVTKGLDKNVEMKDSGVEWLGRTPKHWAILRTKNILNERVEKSITGVEEPLSMSQKFGLIPSKDMESIPYAPASYIGNKKVSVKDLVFNKLKAHLGVFAVSKYEGIVSPDYAVYQANEICDVKYLEYLFKTPQAISEFIKYSRGVGAGLTRLYTHEFFNIKIALPSVEEQQEIVKYLNSKSTAINNLISEKEKIIEELEQYKKSLIYEYVTGKKEV